MKHIRNVLVSKSLFISALILTIGGLLLLQACDNNTTNINSNGPQNGKGRVKVHMTDKPAGNGHIDALTVEIKEIEIHSAGTDSSSKWMVISDSTQMVNILDLTDGTTTLLGTEDLAPGTYNQMRLVLGEHNTITVDGMKMHIKIPSGQQSGIKINLNNGIQISAGETYNLLLDFNAAQSVHMTGNHKFMMKPVIHAVDMQIDGSIKGAVQPSSSNSAIFAINNQQDTTSTYADTANGNFKIVGLAPGTYTLSINPSDTSYADTTLTNISVNSNDSTNVGTINLNKK